MCKVFGVTGVNSKNRSSIIQIMKEITPSMTKFEKDGLGWAGIDKNGNIFGEKWVNTKDAWTKRYTKKISNDVDTPALKQFLDVIDCDPNDSDFAPKVYDKFGEGSINNAVSLILHSRFSTGGNNSINIQNTHPFVKNGTAMIHNGIVYNEDDFKKETSTCDSEILLNQYDSYAVNMDSRAMTDAYKKVDAYFACLFLTQTMTSKEELIPVLDIIVNSASLKLVHVHDLNATFFVTSSQDLIDVCKKKGFTSTKAFDVNENVLIRIDAITGQVLEKQDFDYQCNYKWSNNTSDEAYMKSRYGSEWRDVIEHDLDAPAYRNETTKDEMSLYESTRFPTTNELNHFKKEIENHNLVTYIGNRKY